MRIIADLHIHSRYSRATSPQMNIEQLAAWAKLKGITVLGTGDFTHPAWSREIEATLIPVDQGLFRYQDTYFMLTAEVSSIYKKKGKTYRIHNLIWAPSFKAMKEINRALARIGNIASDGRPILGLDASLLAKIVFDIDPNCCLVPAHIWTPWFSLFGSMSGFDALAECFEEYADKIFCLETGLSSDPAMNWRVSALDRYALISNSDAHSPQKLGREANVFDCELSYFSLVDALQSKDPRRFLYTIEFFPEEGKYHFDGHRSCGVNWSPEETLRHKGVCSKCKKPVTIGVMHRVNELADRPKGYVPKGAIPFKSCVPLDEIIAEARGKGKASAGVIREYQELVRRLTSEFYILLDAPEAQLRHELPAVIAAGIMRMRRGEVSATPGFDGEYGVVSVFGGDPEDAHTEHQLQLFS